MLELQIDISNELLSASTVYGVTFLCESWFPRHSNAKNNFSLCPCSNILKCTEGCIVSYSPCIYSLSFFAMEFSTAERGSRKLIRNGYMYTFKKHYPMMYVAGNVCFGEKMRSVMLPSSYLWQMNFLAKTMSTPIRHPKQRLKSPKLRPSLKGRQKQQWKLVNTFWPQSWELCQKEPLQIVQL